MKSSQAVLFASPRFLYGKRRESFVHRVGLVIASLQDAQCAAARSVMRRTKDFWFDRVQLIRYAMQAFRVAEEQISVGSQVPPQTVDDLEFRFPFEVNDYVAAKDQVKRAKDVVLLLNQIQPLETHRFAKFLRGFDFSCVGAEAFQEKLPLVFDGHSGKLVARPNSL